MKRSRAVPRPATVESPVTGRWSISPRCSSKLSEFAVWPGLKILEDGDRGRPHGDLRAAVCACRGSPGRARPHRGERGGARRSNSLGSRPSASGARRPKRGGLADVPGHGGWRSIESSRGRADAGCGRRDPTVCPELEAGATVDAQSRRERECRESSLRVEDGRAVDGVADGVARRPRPGRLAERRRAHRRALSHRGARHCRGRPATRHSGCGISRRTRTSSPISRAAGSLPTTVSSRYSMTRKRSGRPCAPSSVRRRSSNAARCTRPATYLST